MALVFLKNAGGRQNAAECRWESRENEGGTGEEEISYGKRRLLTKSGSCVTEFDECSKETAGKSTASKPSVQFWQEFSRTAVLVVQQGMLGDVSRAKKPKTASKRKSTWYLSLFPFPPSKSGDACDAL